jgi:hypothetical protein
MDKIYWPDPVRSQEVLDRVKGERNIIRTLKRRKADWNRRNCLIKHVIEGKVEGWIQVVGRRGRRRKELFEVFSGKQPCEGFGD